MKKMILPALSLLLMSVSFADNKSKATEDNAEVTLTGNDQEVAWIGPMHGGRVVATPMKGTDRKKGKCKDKESQQMMVNAAARPYVKQGDVYIAADFLWWQAMENGLPFAIKNNSHYRTTDGAVPNDLSKSRVENVHSHWDPGFRVGIGYNSHNDGWDFSLTGLYFVPKGDKHSKAHSPHTLYATQMHPGDTYSPDTALMPNPQAFSFGNFPSNSSFTKAKSKWNLGLYQLDLEMGREFYVGRKLTTRPFLGIRGSRIKQKINTRYSGSELLDGAADLGINFPSQKVHVSFTNNFWGIGLAGGLDSQWKLARDWSIYGDISFALLYGWIDLHRKDTVKVQPSGSSTYEKYKFVNLKDFYRDLRAIMDFEAGFEWAHVFSNQHCRLSFHAGWENHIYFDQNQSLYFTNFASLGNSFVNQGNLNVQGFTIGGAVDF